MSDISLHCSNGYLGNLRNECQWKMDAAIADTVWLLYCLRHYGADLYYCITDVKKEKNGIDVKMSGGLRTAWHFLLSKLQPLS